MAEKSSLIMNFFVRVDGQNRPLFFAFHVRNPGKQVDRIQDGQIHQGISFDQKIHLETRDHIYNPSHILARA